MTTGSDSSGGLENLAEAFAELVETTVGEFDVYELLQVLVDRCVDVLDVAASGLLVANGDSGLKVMVASAAAKRSSRRHPTAASTGGRASSGPVWRRVSAVSRRCRCG